MASKEDIEKCKQCDAACCKSVAIEWREPTDSEDFEHLKWLVSHKKVNVYQDHDDDWLVEFFADCEHLDEKNMCKIYENRMLICRDHEADECEKSAELEYYQVIFRSYDDVVNYMKKNNIKSKY